MSGLAVLRDFSDPWLGKPARCLLLGDGPGPEGELVRMVYRPTSKGCDLLYLRSYEQGRGHARASLEHLSQMHGDVHVVGATLDAMPFHSAMLAKGIVASVA